MRRFGGRGKGEHIGIIKKGVKIWAGRGEITHLNKKLKVCFASSSGGHFEQLMMLRPLMKKYDSFIVTERTQYSTKAGTEDVHTYYVVQINRDEKAFPIKMLLISICALCIFIREWPDAVISTGVLATIPICLLAKFFRKKVIYIESFAKVTSPTLTGKLLYKYADQFYVQWPQMKEIYPTAIYLGSIY